MIATTIVECHKLAPSVILFDNKTDRVMWGIDSDSIVFINVNVLLTLDRTSYHGIGNPIWEQRTLDRTSCYGIGNPIREQRIVFQLLIHETLLYRIFNPIQAIDRRESKALYSKQVHI
eukprot:TRINITY_DN10240_c2_g1_i1.p1 TRINITY_DN10240_c2_g1~~TRINITY_DN10240_c2_g1_i1.p1  ORF type:complete len:118 (-),score=6.00 TRINITY_DN10240_c2_g1_i1:107-460(-)